jgi:hypothetical protein
MNRRIEKYRKIVKGLGIRILVQKKSKDYSCWRGKTGIIFLSSKNKDLDSAFCHELGHYICYMFGIYPEFHGRKGKKTRVIARKKYGLLVELYVDKLGSKLKKELFPKSGRYTFVYKKKVSREWYKKKIRN